MEKSSRRVIILLSLAAFCLILLGAALGGLVALTVNTKNTEHFTEFNVALPTKLLDINGEIITEFASDEKREIIALNDLPQHMIDALITREDNVFYQHRGFSVKAILRAVIGKVTGRSLGGGSTLTQQIAGTIYCDRSDISISRKIKELWWAIQMERRYSKDEILELYLNKIYFGGGTYGVNAASKYYFGHSAKEITPAEAAILVIQLSNPAHYNPFEYPNRAQERQKYVLDQMVKKGYLTQAESDATFETYWLNFDYTRISSSAYFMREDKAPWFSEYVRRELTSMIYGNQDIYTSGFTVNTTLNLKHQLAAQEIMTEKIASANRSYQNSSGARKSDAAQLYIPLTELFSLVFNIPEIKASEQRNETVAISTFNKEVNPVLDVMSLVFGVEELKVGVVNRANAKIKQESGKTTIEGTMISIENDTGYITALVGGSQFGPENQLIRAVQSKLQPGSSFKPLYYSAAIDSRKYTAASIIYDTPVVFYTEDGVPYIPENFKGEWKGSVQLWYALATSMNVPSLRILDGIGFDAAINRAVALLGIPENEVESRNFARVYPLGLGISDVRPVEMARAFAIFANQGVEVIPMAIRSVADKNGKIFLNPERDIRVQQQEKGSATQIITPQTAYIMTRLLQNTVSDGTLRYGTNYGRKLRYKNQNGQYYTIPIAGKTGTTQNWADAWAVGFTPYYTGAFWFGFDLPGQSLGLEITGSTLAGVALGDFMSVANEDVPFKEFQRPSTGLVEATVCSVSGQILTTACGDHQTTQIFLEGTQPTSICEIHSNRETAFTIGVDRLSTEKMMTGISNPRITDTSELTIDLSFLEENYIPEIESTNTDFSEEMPYIKEEEIKTANDNQTELTEIKEETTEDIIQEEPKEYVPEKNFFLD
jgi:penicillin-binding protein 1A